MKINLITIHVKDMEKSIDFYRRVLGLEVVRELKPTENMRLIFMRNEGEVTVELVEDLANKQLEKGVSNVAIGVDVEDMEKVMKMLAYNNVPPKNGPFETPNGTKLLFIEDPDGVVIEFVQEKA